MEFITNNLPQTLMILGVLALIIEVAVLGMSTFILLFLGISLFATGLMMNFTLLEDSLTTALWSNTLITAACAVLLWKPLKRMQDNVDNKEVKSDFAELDFVLTSDVNELGISTYSYSGVSWKLKSQQPLSAGTHVKVVKKEVGVMWVAVV
ncbi:NfeD family protein [Pseudoalteromonas arctica]|uniref:NfeD family protein n=1 Tax=Pseudoalteromonas arctica TaxID=394751 RepID=A0A7Y0H9R9_9GAMM|nr:NfeD family protein [Pseudoalteromonas arctica]NMM39876.1 NfeD family protein [Pseudoalteromonas arctica]